jgi:TrfA protein
MFADYDDALNYARAMSEKALIRKEVRQAEIEADRPSVYLPEPPYDATRTAPILNRQTIPSLKRVEVRFTGTRLDQLDLDLWLVLCHLSRSTPLGAPNWFSTYALLNALDISDDGRTREDIKESLDRLSSCRVELLQGRGWFIGGLVDSVARKESGDGWRIRLSPELDMLLGPNEWTAVSWPIRRALRGKPLAQWLHGYFSSHTQAHPISIKLLRDLSGSKAEIRSFSSTLRRALSILEKTCNEHGQTFSWSIANGLTHVQASKYIRLKTG